MTLQNLFDEHDYNNIVDDINGEKTGLFMNYFYDKDDKKPSELLGIYISKNQDELFFVLNGEGREIFYLCKKWDRMIRDFIIFGSENREVLERIKYNTIQLVLFQSDIVDRTEELSLNISRKIFLKCTINVTGEIFLDPDEELEVPFYLIQTDTSEIDQNLVSELKQCIPDDNPSLNFLNQMRKKVNKNSKSFSQEEYDLIKGWLTKNEDSED